MSERWPGGLVRSTPVTPAGPTTYGAASGIWTLDQAAYWQKQGLWPNPNIIPDTYFPYVSLLLSTTALGNANNNLFVDSSGAFNPIGRNGNTTQGSFTPYGTFWSNYFDGSGDYLSAGSNSAFAFGTGNYTCEAWVYITGSNTENNLFCNDSTNGFDLYFNYSSSTTRLEYRGGSNVIAFSGVPTRDTWVHVALVREGTGTNQTKLYFNGVLQGSGTDSVNWTVTGPMLIGGIAGAAYLNGYISNARIVKGTAVYTANFTPPTAPLTAVSGTSLLTCQSNRFIDNSSNAFAITANGDTKVTKLSPFSPAYPGMTGYNQSDVSYWSGYFDGSGDYANVPASTNLTLGTGDFTIEMWLYSGANGTSTRLAGNGAGGAWGANKWVLGTGFSGTPNKFFFSVNNTGVAVASTTTFNDSAWHHAAVTRSGNTWRLFVDGVQEATLTSSVSFDGGVAADISIGSGRISGDADWAGYISNFRIIKGTALYTSNFTPSTVPLTAVSGTQLLTCQNAAFTDNSTNNFPVTAVANTTATGASPFQGTGYYSNAFSSGNYLSIADATQFNLSGGSYTIEMWINPLGDYGNYNTLVAKRVLGSSSTAWEVYLRTSTGVLSFYNGTNYESTTTPTPNVWSHVAAVYDGTNMNLYLNGTRVLQSAVSNNNVSAAVQIGTFSSYDERFIGNMSNLRITKGAALYSGASFTPPTGPLTTTVSSGTVSLLTCQSARFIDNSTNNATITVNGSPTVQAFNPFYTASIPSNGGSLYLDGSGDYLTSPTSVNYDFRSGNFTIEGWFYFTNSTANALQTLFSNYTSFSSAGSIFWGKHTNNSGYMTVWISNYSTGSPLLAETSYPPNNSWVHYALVRNGNTFTLYRNGVSTASSTAFTGAATSGACPIWIGTNGDGLAYPFPGYISGFRISKTAVYTATFTPPTAPLTPSATTTLLVNGMNAGAYDATAINDLETVGDAKVSTAVSKYGGSSMAFDGTGDYAVSRGNTILLGSGAFTVEFWVYFNAVNNSTVKYLYDFRTASATSASFLAQEASNAWTYWNGAGSSVTTGLSGSTFATGQWYHVAITRSSNVLYCFVNGTKVSSDPADSSNYASATLTLGARYSGSDGLNGYIDDVRLTAGVARYTSNFTPPTAAFPVY